MTLFEQIEQFLYTHPVQYHKKQLLDLIRSAEEKYLRKIAELEQDAAVAEMNRAAASYLVVDDSIGNSACECERLPEGTACSFCLSQPIYHSPAHDPEDDEERW